MKISLALILALLAPAVAAVAGEPSSVRVVTPKSTPPATRYEVPGRTEPLESATIHSRATGLVSERKYDIGDEVEAGAVLAVISTPEIDRAVEAARANLEQAQARADIAASLARRSTQLRQSNVVSEEESDQRRIASTEASAGVRVAEAELAKLEEQQRFSIVRAPFGGVISAKNFDRGDLARADSSSADAWLYRLDRLDTLVFVISAPPDLALRLARDEEVGIRFGEFPGRIFPAQVSRSSRVFDPASGTMRVELLLDNPDLTLPAGLTGFASFDFTPRENTWYVPANTLLSREGKTFIATTSDGSVRFLEVSTGRNFGKEVEIISQEITATTPVILNPNALLREGDPVSPLPLSPVK